MFLKGAIDALHELGSAAVQLILKHILETATGIPNERAVQLADAANAAIGKDAVRRVYRRRQDEIRGESGCIEGNGHDALHLPTQPALAFRTDVVKLDAALPFGPTSFRTQLRGSYEIEREATAVGFGQILQADLELLFRVDQPHTVLLPRSVFGLLRAPFRLRKRPIPT
jgi:hypothetical protein